MLLHEILESAVRAHLIPSNPCDGVAIPKNSYAPKKILTEAELDRFMKAIAEEPLWYDFFYTEATTGLRRGEICGLKWVDIDFDSDRLSVRQKRYQAHCKSDTDRRDKDEHGQAQYPASAQHAPPAEKAP